MSRTCFVNTHSAPIPVDLVAARDLSDYLEAQSEYSRTLLKSQSFAAQEAELIKLPDMTGNISRYVFGLGEMADPMSVAGLASKLTGGVYLFDFISEGADLFTLYMGWADGAYKFTRYVKKDYEPPQLLISDTDAFDTAEQYRASMDLLRDLVNTPAQDMGPSQIEGEIAALADGFDANVSSTVGDDLLTQNYPMIHAVGRAAVDPPRIVELTWGEAKHPKLVLVGKGISFDTGGLDLKTGGFMRLMKKDMGGSAHAIALARLVMAQNLPVHLTLLIPTAENAIGAGAFRPGDVVPTRKGLNIEIDNTDAEGRLVLCDALARAEEDGEPDLLIDFATLTGAARVAVGPDLAPFYTDDEDLAADIAKAGAAVGDPVWRMPLWKPYHAMLKSSIADCVNSAGGMAGSITAALFLQKFVETQNWVHWDVWAWRKAKYGNPEGAAACGLRAMFEVIKTRYT